MHSMRQGFSPVIKQKLNTELSLVDQKWPSSIIIMWSHNERMDGSEGLKTEGDSWSELIVSVRDEFEDEDTTK